MIYLASPYSHPDHEIMQLRFLQACKAAGEMMALGEVIYSPIAHCHPIATLSSLPTNFEYWEKFDHEMMSLATELRVLKIVGWQESKWVTREIEIAQELGIPVTYIDIVKGEEQSEQL